jgi:hypothetical protein
LGIQAPIDSTRIAVIAVKGSPLTGTVLADIILSAGAPVVTFFTVGHRDFHALAASRIAADSQTRVLRSVARHFGGGVDNAKTVDAVERPVTQVIVIEQFAVTIEEAIANEVARHTLSCLAMVPLGAVCAIVTVPVRILIVAARFGIAPIGGAWIAIVAQLRCALSALTVHTGIALCAKALVIALLGQGQG